MYQGPEMNPRCMTLRERARLMGFYQRLDRRMIIPGLDTQAYRQSGNAVAAPVVAAIAQMMMPRLLHPQQFLPRTVPVSQTEFALDVAP